MTTLRLLRDGPLDAGQDRRTRRSRRSRRRPCRRAAWRPGATPLYAVDAPVPAIVDATCVPWPTASAAGSAVKFFAATTWPVEVRVGRVDAGVEHGDRDALAGVAGLPGGRGADLRDAVVERRAQLAVEPDLGAGAPGALAAEILEGASASRFFGTDSAVPDFRALVACRDCTAPPVTISGMSARALSSYPSRRSRARSNSRRSSLPDSTAARTSDGMTVHSSAVLRTSKPTFSRPVVRTTESWSPPLRTTLSPVIKVTVRSFAPVSSSCSAEAWLIGTSVSTRAVASKVVVHRRLRTRCSFVVGLSPPTCPARAANVSRPVEIAARPTAYGP